MIWNYNFDLELTPKQQQYDGSNRTRNSWKRSQNHFINVAQSRDLNLNFSVSFSLIMSLIFNCVDFNEYGKRERERNSHQQTL